MTTAVIVWFSGVYADSALSTLTGISLPRAWSGGSILYIALHRPQLARSLDRLPLRARRRDHLDRRDASSSRSPRSRRARSTSRSLFDIAPTEGNCEFLPFGGIGILFALPFAIWFFLGIEELPLAAEESHDPTKDIPKAGVWGIVTLALTGSPRAVPQPGGDRHGSDHRLAR